jgi:UDP-N-acetylmuramoyl-L-alanyl-D-glutamate--2,6-diaminopimelate ligase
MTLVELFEKAGVRPDGLDGNAEVSSMVSDSRQVTPGALFVCMPSANSDSHAFIAQAKDAGAAATLVHSQAGVEAARAAGVPFALVENDGMRFNEALWRLAKVSFGNPSGRMKMIGVTGTNGKTTTAWLIRDMLSAIGEQAAYLGTLGIQLPGESRELNNTTPFPIELNALLAEAVAKGATTMAMEVSSHALEQKRVDGLEFDAAVFTNLTQDHLDYHGTMDAYGAAKWRLFTDFPKQGPKRFVAALNLDDPTGADWAAKIDVPCIRFGVGKGDLAGDPFEVLVDSIGMRLTFEGKTVEASIPLGGNFNVQNCLSASAGMLALGYDLGAVAHALRKVRPVPGRFEAVRNDLGIGVLVDYAHTPDALEKLLDSARELHPNRLIAVFGCGGDRDRSKRPKMARVTSSKADISVLTSDNPRTEDPQAILDEVETGIEPGSKAFKIIDRREAIAHAVKIAQPGDIVVIAGKGHENYQIIGRTKYPMDDRELAREALSAR